VSVQNTAKNQPIALFFSLAFGWSWAVWFIGASFVRNLAEFTPILMLGTFGPFLAGFTVCALRGGRAELKTWLSTLVKWRVSVWQYLAVCLTFPLVMLAGLLLIGFPAIRQLDLTAVIPSLTVFMPLNALLTALFTPGPLGEEPGWRGVALPLLLKLGEWPASLLLGLIWALWHLPLALLFPEFRQTVPGVSLAIWLTLFPLSLMAMSVILTLLWKWSGSTLLAVIFHGVVNYTTGTLVEGKLAYIYSPLETFGIIVMLFWIAAAVFIAFDRWFVRSKASIPRLAASADNRPI